MQHLLLFRVYRKPRKLLGNINEEIISEVFRCGIPSTHNKSNARTRYGCEYLMWEKVSILGYLGKRNKRLTPFLLRQVSEQNVIRLDGA